MTALRARLRIAVSRRAFRTTKRIDRRADLPNPLQPKILYIVGTPAQWLIFLCPCHQGHDIALDIANSTWHLDGRRRRPTIRPSINSHSTDRRCHFWITKGKIQWCPDTHSPNRPPQTLSKTGPQTADANNRLCRLNAGPTVSHQLWRLD